MKHKRMTHIKNNRRTKENLMMLQYISLETHFAKFARVAFESCANCGLHGFVRHGSSSSAFQQLPETFLKAVI